MKIKKLVVTIEPIYDGDERYVFCVEGRIDSPLKNGDRLFGSRRIFDFDHFEDMLSYLMEDAEYQIKELIRKAKEDK